jgi:hypothetical protein
MDESGRVLERLRRIDALRSDALKAGGAPGELLDELRALVPEAEAWARLEGDARAQAAAARLREAEVMR